MASVWIRTRRTKNGAVRYLVEYRLGGRDSKTQHGGSFRTRRLATRPRRSHRARPRRAPHPQPPPRTRSRIGDDTTPRRRTLADLHESTSPRRRPSSTAPPSTGRCPSSAAAPSTRSPRRTSPNLSPQLAADGKARESIRKTLTALAMVFDHAGINPNPARDRSIVKLPERSPRSRTRRPPTTSRPSTGSSRRGIGWRCSSSTGPAPASPRSTGHCVGDYDEQRRRVRLRAATTKTRRALWVELHPRARRRARGRPRTARGPRPGRRGCSRTAARTRCARRSRRRARPPACRSGRRTTSDTGGSASCTCAASPGRGSASRSGSATSPSPRTPTRTSCSTKPNSTTGRCST